MHSGEGEGERESGIWIFIKKFSTAEFSSSSSISDGSTLNVNIRSPSSSKCCDMSTICGGLGIICRLI